jgi:rRNA-processing protein FCF1
MTELRGLGNNTGLVGDAAKSAMIAINKSIAERKDVRIITAKGSDVTKQTGFYHEKLENDPNDDDEARNIDDVIIKITKHQAVDRAAKSTYSGNAEHAILLTEDTNMRVKANARGVPAISTTVLKRYLFQLGPGGTGNAAAALASPSSPSKRKSPSPQMRKDDDPNLEEDGDIRMTTDPSDEKRPPRKRTYKRGKTTLELGR